MRRFAVELGVTMRRTLQSVCLIAALMIVPAAASAKIVKGNSSEFAKVIDGAHRDVGVYHGDVLLGLGGSVTVGADPSHHPDPNPHPHPAVPEPATWATFLLGFGLMGYALRRRRLVVAAS